MIGNKPDRQGYIQSKDAFSKSQDRPAARTSKPDRWRTCLGGMQVKKIIKTTATLT